VCLGGAPCGGVSTAHRLEVNDREKRPCHDDHRVRVPARGLHAWASHVACRVLRECAAWCMVSVACCMVSVACCMVSVACCVSMMCAVHCVVAWCMLPCCLLHAARVRRRVTMCRARQPPRGLPVRSYRSDRVGRRVRPMVYSLPPSSVLAHTTLVLGVSTHPHSSVLVVSTLSRMSSPTRRGCARV
jgi:hypothetical protein